MPPIDFSCQFGSILSIFVCTTRVFMILIPSVIPPWITALASNTRTTIGWFLVSDQTGCSHLFSSATAANHQHQGWKHELLQVLFVSTSEFLFVHVFSCVVWHARFDRRFIHHTKAATTTDPSRKGYVWIAVRQPALLRRQQPLIVLASKYEPSSRCIGANAADDRAIRKHEKGPAFVRRSRYLSGRAIQAIRNSGLWSDYFYYFVSLNVYKVQEGQQQRWVSRKDCRWAAEYFVVKPYCNSSRGRAVLWRVTPISDPTQPMRTQNATKNSKYDCSTQRSRKQRGVEAHY